MPYLASFVLLAYNSESYIIEAVEAAFAQDYPNLEIILSDDCSTDNTVSILENLVAHYKGPHQVVLNKNEKNLGIGGHVNKVMQMAHGDLLVLAAGDDISDEQRVSTLMQVWKEEGKPLMIHSAFRRIDEEGQLLDTKSREVPHNIQGLSAFRSYLGFKVAETIGASCAYASELYTFNGLRSDVISEDLSLFLRALMLKGRVHFVNKELLSYRTHTQNVTGIEGRGAMRFLTWTKRHRASYQGLLTDMRKAGKEGYTAYKERFIVKRNIWSGQLLEYWHVHRLLRVLTIVLPLLLIGNNRLRKFVLNNSLKK